jgi:hypothetical protein
VPRLAVVGRRLEVGIGRIGPCRRIIAGARRRDHRQHDQDCSNHRAHIISPAVIDLCTRARIQRAVVNMVAGNQIFRAEQFAQILTISVLDCTRKM